MAAQSLTKITNYTKYFSRIALKREPSAIRALTPLFRIPGMLSLGGGLPNAKLFPFQSVQAKLKTGETIELEGLHLDIALQYSPSTGIPELIEKLRGLIKEDHKPPAPDADWSICVFGGSQDGLAKLFELFLDENDPVLVESPTYSGALSALRPWGLKLIEVPLDGHGIIPEELDSLLNNFPTKFPGVNKPKVLYTIPTGQNPSGATLDNARREKIYAIAQKHDFLIIEDDPYWYLRLNPLPGQQATEESELKSFFSMDVDGRVVRTDSVSKILSSGLRLGWVTGPSALINRLEFHQQATNLHASGLTQMLVYKLLDQWGTDGFKKHIQKVKDFYSEKRDVTLRAAEKHLKGLAEWSPPSAGMFIWFKLNGISDTENLIKEKAVKAKVVMVPGKVFSPSNSPSPYVRAAFSTASEEDIDEALRRLANLLREEINGSN
jgi:kynurenine/2-aminoadipate aminotransferase